MNDEQLEAVVRKAVRSATTVMIATAQPGTLEYTVAAAKVKRTMNKTGEDLCVYRYTGGNSIGHEAVRSRDDYDWQVRLISGAPTRSLETHGASDLQPKWLQDVLALAALSDNVLRPVYPPPATVVWFVTTPDGRFVKFYDWN